MLRLMLVGTLVTARPLSCFVSRPMGDASIYVIVFSIGEKAVAAAVSTPQTSAAGEMGLHGGRQHSATQVHRPLRGFMLDTARPRVSDALIFCGAYMAIVRSVR
jgi:hypothetical protein